MWDVKPKSISVVVRPLGTGKERRHKQNFEQIPDFASLAEIQTIVFRKGTYFEKSTAYLNQ